MKSLHLLRPNGCSSHVLREAIVLVTAGHSFPLNSCKSSLAEPSRAGLRSQLCQTKPQNPSFRPSPLSNFFMPQRVQGGRASSSQPQILFRFLSGLSPDRQGIHFQMMEGTPVLLTMPAAQQTLFQQLPLLETCLAQVKHLTVSSAS